MTLAAVAGEFRQPSHEAWLAAVEKGLKGAPFSSLVSQTADEIAVQPLYRKANRGHVPGTTGARAWQILARVDHPDAWEANALALQELEGGATGLVLMRGCTAARGFGAATMDVDLLRRALDGVELDLIALRIEPSLHCESSARAVVDLVAERRLTPAALDIDFGFDAVAAHGAASVTAVSWDEVQCELARVALRLKAEGFHGPFLTMDARIWHDAGASEAQEIGLVLAAAVSHLRALEYAGWEAAHVTKALSAIVAVDTDQFLGVAKLRALRHLHAKLLNACGLPAGPLTIHAETSWRMMTRQDPWSNILRATIAAFAAGVGGVDSMVVLPHTQPLGLPDALARRVARNTHHILLREAHLRRVDDPVAGSGAFEALTEALVERGWDVFQAVERAGGLGRALSSGVVQDMIAERRKARHSRIATGEQTIVGTSRFFDRAATVPAVLTVIDESITTGASAFGLPILRDAQPLEGLRASVERRGAEGQRPVLLTVPFGDSDSAAALLSVVRMVCDAVNLQVATRQDAEVCGSLKLPGEGSAGWVIACLCGGDGAHEEPAEDAIYPGESRIAEVARLLRTAGFQFFMVTDAGEGQTCASANTDIDQKVVASCDFVGTLTLALDAME